MLGHTAFGPLCAHVFAALPLSCTTRARATALGKEAGDAAGLRSRRPPRLRPAVAPLRAATRAHTLRPGLRRYAPSCHGQRGAPSDKPTSRKPSTGGKPSLGGKNGWRCG